MAILIGLSFTFLIFILFRVLELRFGPPGLRAKKAKWLIEFICRLCKVYLCTDGKNKVEVSTGDIGIFEVIETGFDT